MLQAPGVYALSLCSSIMGPMIRAGNEKQVKANLARLEQGVEATGHAT